MAYYAPIAVEGEVFEGEDKRLAFTIYDTSGYASPRDANAAVAAGTAPRQSLSGFALSWMVKRSKTDPDTAALITKTSSAGITVTDAAQGQGYVAVSAEDLAAIEAERTHHHELKRTNIGTRTVLAYGRFSVTQAVHDGPAETT